MDENNEKYQQMLSTSLELFAKFGYKKTTVEDVATSINMTKGNLYFYVKNKKDLYEKTIDFALNQWKDFVNDAVNKEKDVVSKFRILAQKSIEYIENNRTVQTILINDPSIFTLSSTEDRFYNTNVSAMNIIKKILEQGIEEKMFFPVDVEHITEYLFSVYIMFLIKSYVKSDNSSLKKMFSEGLELTIRGLLLKGTSNN
ncbi:MAG: TetR/AcrR family transcriptional regulator [Deltaproteobacteria bacterium]|nr:TetR/AcrR family transcriptional regulator [Deltaproteobacteria bacterium]